ncbi:hypothetical protein ACTXT7_017053, partial [Hymenolepis weldensis]
MTLSVHLSSRFMAAHSRFLKEVKRLSLSFRMANNVLSVDRVKHAYLDKFVTKNAISIFPPIKETIKPMPVTRSGRH